MALHNTYDRSRVDTSYAPYRAYGARPARARLARKARLSLRTHLTGREPAVGLGAQLLLLALLGATTGLGPAGWLTGTVYGVMTCAVLTRALRRAWPRPFGPADRVTHARATLVGGVTALVADSFGGRPPISVLAALTTIALILDSVDGRVARRTGTASPLGARFDMEVDAVLILVLSVFVAQSLGAWVVLIGAMRYAFVAAAWTLPWLRGPLPPSMARKTVAALQGIVLAAAATGILPSWPTLTTVAGALALLVWSFGRDVGGLWRGRERGTERGGERRSATADRPVLTPATSAAARGTGGQG